MSKVVVIGSGLGGLSCAYILQKNGYDVTVLEQGLQPGGCLQCFTRRGAKFETGMHYIGSAAPGQIMDKMLGYFGLKDKVELSPLSADAYNTVNLCGQDFRFPSGREAFLERMSGYFPSERDNLQKYLSVVDEVSKFSSLAAMTGKGPDSMQFAQYQLLALDEVMDSLFTDPFIKDVLVGDQPLYAAVRGKTPFAQHAFIMDFYNKSAFRFAGGSDSLAYGLKEGIEKMGGRVLTGRKVVKVHCNDVKATGVETLNQEFYEADYIISAIHPKRLLETLDTKLIRPAFRSRINGIPESEAPFVLYVKFREGAMPYMNTNYFGYESGTSWGCENYSASDWPKGFLYMHMCDHQNQKWARSAEVIAYMKMTDVLKWKGTSIGRRGADYEEFKRMHAEKLLDTMEKHRKGFRAAVESYWTSTPLSYLDYTGTEDGGLYGVAKDVNLGPAGRVPYKTKIPNLLLAGQNVNSHGILGVLVGTIVSCCELVSPELLAKQINGSSNE